MKTLLKEAALNIHHIICPHSFFSSRNFLFMTIINSNKFIHTLLPLILSFGGSNMLGSGNHAVHVVGVRHPPASGCSHCYILLDSELFSSPIKRASQSLAGSLQNYAWTFWACHTVIFFTCSFNFFPFTR